MVKNKQSLRFSSRQGGTAGLNFPGLFIAFEGIDGAGSSTQVVKIGNILRKSGLRVLKTKEPTNNVIGGLIRGTLTGDLRLPPDALQLLFSADRAHHLAREITPALKKKYVVLTDRYFFSTIAYGALDLEKKWLYEINKYFLVPDLVFVLNLPAKVSVERIKTSRYEVELFEKEEKLRAVSKNYLTLARQYSKVTHVVDASMDKSEVSEKIFEVIKANTKYKKLLK